MIRHQNDTPKAKQIYHKVSFKLHASWLEYLTPVEALIMPYGWWIYTIATLSMLNWDADDLSSCPWGGGAILKFPAARRRRRWSGVILWQVSSNATAVCEGGGRKRRRRGRGCQFVPMGTSCRGSGHPALSIALARSQIVTGRQTGNEFSISQALSLAHLASYLFVKSNNIS